jgi:coproporphyrinogen III oxidase-like Fe-S oxidoreductase
MGKEVSEKSALMLFALGQYYKEVNKKFNAPMQVAISKVDFIQLVQKAGITEKKERSIYRNLEILEKEKLIAYKNHMMQLTPKGMKMFAKLEKQVRPYIKIIHTVESQSLSKYTKKAQAVFVQDK